MNTYNLETIREACFDLATKLMWEKDRRTNDNITCHINELTEMSNNFYEIATDLLELLEGMDGHKFEIMVRAIYYLTDSQAIPPLKGNYPWFRDGLMTLIEMLNPNSSIRKSNIVFINLLENGLQKVKTYAVDDEELLSFD